ncbi:MAG: siphovirus Gp157 family protein [Oscillospiraceae bacterium]|nr:siphovirus Gp157 family protein [Oscillospiraceae bacterium]
MSRLFEISNGFAALFDQLESFDEIEETDMREIAQQAWFDTLEGIEAEFEIKAENVAQYIKGLRKEAEDIKEEEQALAARRKAKERSAKNLTDYLMACMKQIHREKIETAKCKLSIRKNAESVQVADEDGLARQLAALGRADLIRVKPPELDKTALKKALQAGEIINGAALGRTESLIIK